MGRLCETTQGHATYPWAVAWRCPTCNVNFHCCDRTCGPRSRKVTAFATHAQLTLHHRRQHKKPRLASVVDPGCDFVDDDPLSDALMDIDESPTCLVPTDAFHVFRDHLPTKRFFDDLHNHSFVVAVQALVARSCYLDARMLDTADTCLSVTDLTLFFQIARLVFELGPKHQQFPKCPVPCAPIAKLHQLEFSYRP